MSSYQTLATSFRAECWQAVHSLLTDTIKLALYTAGASINEATTAYAATNEVVASGYIAGGSTLTGTTIATSGTTAYASFNDIAWAGVLTARYALIYNASKGNKAIAVLDFGADKTSTVAFTVQMPPNTATSALLRSST